ncbi:MAG: hypothetical protein AB8G99_11165 [Planctomycetaceae bacterium]
MPDHHAEPADCWKSTYSIVAKVASVEKEQSDGVTALLRLIENNGLPGANSDPLPEEISTQDHVLDLIAAAEHDISSSLFDSLFKDVVGANPKAILINIETGDVPELINAGYPYAEGLEFNFQPLEDLKKLSYFTLDDFLTKCAGKPFDELEYFEFADLSYLNFGGRYETWSASDVGIDAKRSLLASVAMIAGIRSLRDFANENPTPESIWLSVSEGCRVMGALTRVQ